MTYDTSTSSFTEDTSWTSKTVIYQNNTLELSSSSSSVLSFYKAGLDLTIPTDFNPDSVVRASNDEVTPETKADDIPSQIPSKVVDTYSDQVTASGVNTNTTTAATTMLSTIETTLSSESSSMRYSSDFYLAVREGLLSRSIGFSDSTDGTLGQLTNPYVFFTNEADSNGDHHPFMVIASYGLPESLALLWDIAQPPGDGLTSEYSTQEVTRSFHREGFLTKIPLRDYGEVSSLTENTMEGSLADDVGETDYDNFNYASRSATGMAIDGVLIYPSYNNVLDFSQTHAELSAQGLHAGKGLGLHYHADAHSATHSELNLYNSSDYTDQTHPPLVSMGFDGVAGYGIYESGDTTSDGVSVALDAYGAHEHDDYGYHYHAYPKTETSSNGNSYTVHTLPPQGAWGGQINDIPEFWDGTAPNYVGGASSYLGTE